MTNRERIARLEKRTPDLDRFTHYGEDGKKLRHIVVAGTILGPDERKMTQEDADWLRSLGHAVIFIPDDDDRPEPEDFPDEA
jgi:hypothetical protein